MQQFRLKYNYRVTGGFAPSTQDFTEGPADGDTDGYLAPGHYRTADDARYAAYARLEDVKRQWPDLNKFPYGEPKIFAREVGEWEDITDA